MFQLLTFGLVWKHQPNMKQLIFRLIIIILYQAAAELCLAKVKLEVILEFGIEFGEEIETCHY